MFSSVICRLFVIALTGWSISANADKAPPGSEWVVDDSLDWSASWIRVGTDGTMWDKPTVGFKGVFEKSGNKSVDSDLAIHISDTGALFVIRNDYELDLKKPVRTCTYHGHTDVTLNSIVRLSSSVPQIKISGTFLCSDMDKEGTWKGHMR